MFPSIHGLCLGNSRWEWNVCPYKTHRWREDHPIFIDIGCTNIDHISGGIVCWLGVFACQRVIVMECLMCTHVVSNGLEIFEFSRVQPESDTQCSQLGKVIIRSDRKRCGPLLVYARLVPKCWFQPVWPTFDDFCAGERRKGKKDLWPTRYWQKRNELETAGVASPLHVRYAATTNQPPLLPNMFDGWKHYTSHVVLSCCLYCLITSSYMKLSPLGQVEL